MPEIFLVIVYFCHIGGGRKLPAEETRPLYFYPNNKLITCLSPFGTVYNVTQVDNCKFTRYPLRTNVYVTVF